MDRYVLIGCTCAMMGGAIWWMQEENRVVFNAPIGASIALIVIGAIGILIGVDHYIRARKGRAPIKPAVKNPSLLAWIYILGLIFLGSVSYTIAAYYHLKLDNWSFLTAFAIAIPLILIEYQFSIRGNFYANEILQLNALQITVLTMTFYFINVWALNYFVLKQPIIWWRELLAFMCIILAFLLATNRRIVTK